MNLKILIFLATILTFSYASMFDSFSSYSTERKLYLQALKTYDKFKENFTKKLLKNEITTEEHKAELIQGLQDAGAEKEMKEFLLKGGPIEDPQIHLGKLAFLYTVLNRADYAAAASLRKICIAENLLDSKTNPNVCNTYAPYMVKLIEIRISAVTSRILFSSGLLGIPKGWIEHVQGIVKDLEISGMLSDSLKHLLYLLRGVAQNNEEIDTSILPNILNAKTHQMTHENSGGNQIVYTHPQIHQQQAPQPIIITAPSQPPPPPQRIIITAPSPPAQKITIDARNLGNRTATDSALDSLMGQMIQKMMI